MFLITSFLSIVWVHGKFGVWFWLIILRSFFCLVLGGSFLYVYLQKSIQNQRIQIRRGAIRGQFLNAISLFFS